ncbi:MAG: hypothetical protein RIQ60_2740 [Pseudomonadota bacterium]|jgi:fucose permease
MNSPPPSTAPTSVPLAAAPASARLLLALICLAFLILGMAQAGVGPTLPDLARQTNSSTVEAGGALSAWFAGALIGFPVAGLLLRRFAHLRVLCLGWTAFALGLAGMVFSPSLVWMLVAAWVLGLGAGTLVLAGNLLAAQAAPGAGALNLVNAIYGVGAIASPALVGLALTQLGTGLPALRLVCGVALLGLLVALVVLARASYAGGLPPRPVALPASAPGHASEALPARPAHPLDMLRSRLLWACCAFFFTYVAVEVSLGGWLTILLERATGMSMAAGAAVMSWFWVLLTAVRFLAAWAGRHVTTRQTLRCGTGLCVAGGTLLVLSAALHSPLLGIAGASLFGLGLGPIMPTLTALMQQAFGRDAGWAAGVAMSTGSLGAALVPWLVGAAVVHLGALPGAAILLFMPLGMVVSLALVERCLHQHPQAHAAAILRPSGQQAGASLT